MDPLGLYVHVPFCASICSYCHFTRGFLDEALKRRYVKAVRAEIHRASRDRAVDTVYFGGGTPSLLSPDEVADVLAACRAAFAVSPDAEITLEANPETVTRASLAAFRSAGVNRLSLGAQSFVDEELRRLERRHDAAQAERALAEARAAGFDNVSVDLMLAIPGQSLETAQYSVRRLAALGPEHASVYLLELDPDTRLPGRMAQEGWTTVDEDGAAEMYVRCLEALETAGYEHYEISNLARPGRRSRHNLKYWADGEWVGVGCAAHSTIDHVRSYTVQTTVEYVGRVEAGVSTEAGRRELTPREQVEEALIMGLRLAGGVSQQQIDARYGVDVWRTWGSRLVPYVEAGLLIHDGDRLRLTKEGMLVSNEVMGAFLSAASTVK